MTSAVCSPGLTLAPFWRMYDDAREAFLTDSFFATPKQRAFGLPNEQPAALVPKIVSIPNRARFEAAVSKWLEDIEFDSLPDAMKDHESFQAIVQDGPAVVPLIAAHLRRKPSFLFLALEELFGEDPVPEEAYGNLKTTVSAWLRWLQR